MLRTEFRTIIVYSFMEKSIHYFQGKPFRHLISAGSDLIALVSLQSAPELSEYDYTEPLVWRDIQGKKHYPTNEEFGRMVQRTTLFKYNVTLASDKLKSLLRFTNSQNRQAQMDDIWRLIQDSDFLMAKAFEQQELFATVIGQCGNVYAIEYMESLMENTGLGIMSIVDWKTRIKSAVLILDYLKELDKMENKEAIKLCEIKFRNFGISENK